MTEKQIRKEILNRIQSAGSALRNMGEGIDESDYELVTNTLLCVGRDVTICLNYLNELRPFIERATKHKRTECLE